MLLLLLLLLLLLQLHAQIICLQDASFGPKGENVTKIDILWRSNVGEVAQVVVRNCSLSCLPRLHPYPLAFEDALTVRFLSPLPSMLPLFPDYSLPNSQFMLHLSWKPMGWWTRQETNLSDLRIQSRPEWDFYDLGFGFFILHHYGAKKKIPPFYQPARTNCPFTDCDCSYHFPPSRF